MTVMAAEAAAGGAGRAAAGKQAAKKTAARKPAARKPSGKVSERPIGQHRVTEPRTTGRHRAPSRTFDERAQLAAYERGQQAAAAAPGYARSRITGVGAPGGDRYQAAILLEFLVAALVVAFAPLASGPKDDKGGPSPYRTGDLAQLAAIGIVYFLLAAWSGTGRGRPAAWFGFLILLGILFRKAVSGELTAEVAPLTGKPPEEGPGSAQAA